MTSDDQTPTDQVPDDRAAEGSHAGHLSAPSGTPVPVDVGQDVRSRHAWAMLVAGPVIWITHFMVVYLIAEAGCTGDRALLDWFDPPVPVVATWVATLVAVPATAAAALWAWRSWRRGHDRPDAGRDASEASIQGQIATSPLAFVGLVLSLLSVVAILFTAAPALVLSCSS